MIQLNRYAKPTLIKETSLADMNGAVKGAIQMLSSMKDMTVYCNEEGLLLGLNPSSQIPAFLKYLGFDVRVRTVFGNVVIHGLEGDLTKNQQESIMRQYKEWKVNRIF